MFHPGTAGFVKRCREIYAVSRVLTYVREPGVPRSEVLASRLVGLFLVTSSDAGKTQIPEFFSRREGGVGSFYGRTDFGHVLVERTYW